MTESETVIYGGAATVDISSALSTRDPGRVSFPRPPVEFGKTRSGGAKCIFGNREQVIIPLDAVSCLVHAAR